MRIRPTYTDPLSRQLHALGHDLRAPLRSMEQGLELAEMAEGQIDEDTLDLMRQGVQWMRLMVDNLVEDAQLRSGRLHFHMDDLDLVPFMRSVAVDLEKVARRQGVDFDLQCKCPDVLLRCDRVKLMRCLANLFTNALKHTPEGGKIIMEVRLLTDELSICIIDSGEGLESGQLQQIVKAINRRRLRTSLPYWSEIYGLSLVSAFARHMNGRVEMQSQRGAGTQVALLFPLQKTPR